MVGHLYRRLAADSSCLMPGCRRVEECSERQMNLLWFGPIARRQSCTNPWAPVMLQRVQAYRGTPVKQAWVPNCRPPHSSPFYQTGWETESGRKPLPAHPVYPDCTVTTSVMIWWKKCTDNHLMQLRPKLRSVRTMNKLSSTCNKKPNSQGLIF